MDKSRLIREYSARVMKYGINHDEFRVAQNGGDVTIYRLIELMLELVDAEGVGSSEKSGEKK